TIESMFGLVPDRPVFPREMWAGRDRRRRVVLLLLDGFAFAHFLRYHRQHRFFSRIAERGDVHPLTSVFPSTTPAALTTLHTGLTPQEHGLPEWTVYFDELGTIVETRPFRAHGTPGRDTLLQSGGQPRMLYEGDTIYTRLATSGIPSFVFQFHAYVDGAYSRATQ